MRRAELQILGFKSWNHSIWVCREPELQTARSRPRAAKKGMSSEVAPVMAKLAPRWNVAFFALDGGSSGRPSSWAAHHADKASDKDRTTC